MRLEDGTVRGGIRQADNFTPPFDLDGTLIGTTFVLPPISRSATTGLHLRSGDREFDTALIVTPAWLGMPARMGIAPSRAWQPPSFTACGPRARGDSATSPTSPTSR